ncbi:SusC/RagA family TonB-linked outer membrane protein [Rhodoflexus caldus]|uniref:SusC/RagA family TonB-linked outer membrane protein n=1 Tax=Rhodoflexus caldus TaxID=2891236 RepID=UPI00202A9361|nr:SusC/RagA family TonB-linked outer membrane protein [Rhodoflexus caldus]
MMNGNQLLNTSACVKWLFALLCCWGIGFSAFAQVQMYTISGRVTDAGTNDPLIGASIQLKGTSTGTITDVEGKFSMTASVTPGDYTLVFSFVGYARKEQKITLGSQTNVTVDVALKEDFIGLEEVVVTGTSIATSKKQLGNSVHTVSARQMQQVGTPSLSAALQGKIAGAQITQNSGDPAGGVSIRLRGASSINSSSEPLYIVDGVIVNNNTNNVTNLAVSISGGNDFQPGQNRLLDINPNDIERIEVLNGAAAAAIYGSRANNGVIQIFTKRGSTGKPKLTFSTSLMISQLRKEFPLNTHPERFGPPVTRTGFGNDQRLPGILLFNRLFTEKTPVTRYNYWDDIFQTALGTDNYVSVAGGKDDTKYFFSTSYFKNQGIVRNTDFERITGRLRIDQKMTDWAKFSAGLNYTRSFANEKPDANTFNSPVNSVFITDNVYNLKERDANGNLLPVEPVRMNPLSVIEDLKQTNQTSRMIGDFQLNLAPLKGLGIDYVFGMDTYTQLGQNFFPRIAYPGVNAALFPDGYAANATAQVLQLNNDLNISYQADISEKLKSTTQLGATWQYDRSNFAQAQGRDMVPFIETISGATNLFTPATEVRTERSIQGYFLQQTFNYGEFLFVTAAGRMDASSVFGPNSRWQFFPKASANLILSEMDFWKNASFANKVSTFKLRTAYGESGNLTGIGPYDRFSNTIPVQLVGRQSLIRSTVLGNPDVKPERQAEIEVGTDIYFLDNRFGIELTWYNKEVRDLLLERTIAPSEGGASINANVGSMTNKGIELALRANILKNKDWNWNATLIYSRNRNKVNIPQEVIRFSTDANRMSSAVNGYPLGVFYGTAYARNPDGSLLLTNRPQVIGGVTLQAGLPQPERVGRNAEGQPTGALVNRVLGDPNPRYTASLLNDVSWKNFNFRLLFDAVQGFQVNNLNWTTANNVGIGPLAAQELRGELPRGWVSLVGGFGGERIREEMVKDGSFVKLREISLSYTLTPQALGLSNLTLGVSGRNLISWDNYPGFDPEVNSGGQSNRIRGDDFGTVPIPRTFQFNLSAQF